MTPLGAILARRIALEGPVSVAEYMAMALGHPEHGYYATRDPLGAAGDFTTAPEVSQVFGELLGLWLVDRWNAAGRPGAVDLVELGPGRGTLMADALRAARLVPAFGAAARVGLVETSPVLRRAQAAALAGLAEPRWLDTLGDLAEADPPRPLFLVANEFFDALPVRQFVATGQGWRERMVALDPDGERLVFGLGPANPGGIALIDPAVRATAAEGAVVETRPAALAVMAEIARRVSVGGGAALIVDYGHATHAAGDTLQAVRRHAYADPLDAPGEADLTAHVDFAALAAAAREAGAVVAGPVEQGTFLRDLGIEARAAALTRARPDRAETIAASVARLTGPEAMGRLFKAMAVLPAGEESAPPGF
ncbi:MAG: SAM-dependent methyltransferase [Azospirillaceae bacterium]